MKLVNYQIGDNTSCIIVAKQSLLEVQASKEISQDAEWVYEASMKEAFLYDNLVRNLSANLNAVLLQLFVSLFLVFNDVFYRKLTCECL